MRILVADDDSVFRRFVKRIVEEKMGDEVTLVEDGKAALRAALSPDPPDVLLLDWLMPEMNGTQVCKIVRAASIPVQPYVLFATARARREEVIECLATGADDLLTKPIAPDLLIARLNVPKLRVRYQLPAAQRVKKALVEGCKEGSGELVVRSGETSARVFVHDGRVAWAHLADGSGGLLEILAPDAGVSSESARAAIEECRRTGGSLSETLVKWGFVDRARLRESIGVWIRKKVDAICRLPEPEVLFLPTKRSYAEDMLFDLDELIGRVESSSHSLSSLPVPAAEQRPTLIPSSGWDGAFFPSREQHPDIELLLKHCQGVDGVLGVAVLDRLSGCCLGKLGAELNADVAWAHIQCINSVLREERVEDSVVSTDRHFHMALVIPARPTAFVYCLLDSSKTALGIARVALKKAVSVVSVMEEESRRDAHDWDLPRPRGA